MLRVGPYEFRFAETAADFDRVHRLNYDTFVREIPQHADPGTGILIDKFHAKNRYLIAERDGGLVGMLAAHDAPPFSIADRLPDPGILTAPGVRVVEIRLLSVVPAERHSPVMAGLVWALYQHAVASGYTHYAISGVAERQPLYERMGFEPLGPAVGTGRAAFIPMWVRLDRLREVLGRGIALWERRLRRKDEG